MLTQAATPELIAQWKALFQKYRPLLRPNRKPASLLASFLMECYPLSVCTDHCWEEAIRGNMLENPFEWEKLPPGAFPLPVALRRVTREVPSMWGWISSRDISRWKGGAAFYGISSLPSEGWTPWIWKTTIWWRSISAVSDDLENWNGP